MIDCDIRQALLKSILRQHRNDQAALIIEELGLCRGDSRIDIAVIDGKIGGYEIKSEKDSLRRLSRQVKIYNRIFDCVTIVAAEQHISAIREIVPKWWGLQKAIIKRGKVQLIKVRLNRNNPAVDPTAIVQFLWRDEAFKILKEKNIHIGMSNKPKAVLWASVVENCSLVELRSVIRNVMRQRENWRSVSQQIPNGG